MSELKLPAGWIRASWREVVAIIHGKSQKGIEVANGKYPIYGSGGIIGYSDSFLCRAESTIIGRKGTINNPIFATDKFWNIDTAFGITASDAILPKFLFNFCKSFNFLLLDSSTTLPSLTQNNLYSILMPLPPLNEQRRIAAKIEALQTRSKNARTALEEAQTLLEQLRQSVLTAAFTGKLTEKWRAEHPDAEPATTLLQRIRKERRKRWEEAELAKYSAKGKTPPAGWQKKYPEPVTVDTSELPELPEGWCWASLDELCDVRRGKSKHRPRNDARLFGNTSPFIQTGEVARANRYITSATKFYSEFGVQQSQIFPRDTLCVTIAANIADTAILCIDACFPDSVVGILSYSNIISSEYLEFYISSVKNDLSAIAPATAQKNINLEILHAVAVPIPPLQERYEIEHVLLNSWGTIESLKFKLQENLCELGFLDQSILAKAFRGELVPQDPNDEPASKLLERIRRDKESGSRPNKKNRAKG